MHVGPTVGVVEQSEPGAESCLVTIGGDADWVARYLASLPVDFEVLEPPRCATSCGRWPNDCFATTAEGASVSTTRRRPGRVTDIETIARESPAPGSGCVIRSISMSVAVGPTVPRSATLGCP